MRKMVVHFVAKALRISIRIDGLPYGHYKARPKGVSGFIGAISP